jgi:uncharacterized protein
LRNVLVDTGFWLAISNAKDKHHKKAMKWLADNQTVDYRFATTWIVMCESFYLIKNLISYSKAVALFEAYSRSEFDIIDLKLEQSARMIEIMGKYEDLDIDLADISMVILAEHLNTGDILTVDHNDFDALRWNRNRRFKILLR